MVSLLSFANRLAEEGRLPDALLLPAVRWRVRTFRGKLAAQTPDPIAAEFAFAKAMVNNPIALFTDAANEQHYELPPAFFGHVLGPNRKYSSCLYDRPEIVTLADAEARALSETAAHADLIDGQDVLELGCGWGSLTLWMASHYPQSRITAVSNSAPQRAYIEETARVRGLSNVRVITADMNHFQAEGTYDRVVSVEMFEHMANWDALLRRVKSWLRDDGRVFIHVFTHRSTPYPFDHGNKNDWIAQYFFTGGIMPSHGLMHRFPEILTVEKDWQWNGQHYEKTALDWLANFDRHHDVIMPILRTVYGTQARLWYGRWRLFFLATAGLFGDDAGREWGVSHYRLKKPC